MQKKIFCICFVFLCIIGIYCGYSIENEQKNIVKEDEQLDYAKLAADENSQMENLLKENYEAVKPPESEKKEEVKSEKGDVKAIEIDIEKLKDVACLKKTFYQVDSSTSISADKLDVEKLLGADLSIQEDVDGPQILIYHTHSQEGYSDSVKGDESTTVIGVGDYLAQILEEEYGFKVLHHKGKYDVNDRDHAYSNAESKIKKIIKEHPSIQLVIDLHRDGVLEGTRLVTDIDGKKIAQIMFFNGLSYTNSVGEIEYLKNPYIDTQLAMSFQMQFKAAEYYPGLTRRIYLKGYRYNMHVCPKTMLVEVGAQTNTLEEAKNAMIPLANVISKVIRK